MATSASSIAMNLPENNPASPAISVVIPMFNSGDSLALLVGELREFFNEAGISAEILLINDGSRDRSWETAQSLLSGKPQLIAVNLTKNFGQHAALLVGLKMARGEIVITMDDDLQHPPSQIPLLIAEIQNGNDVVYGVPAQERHGLWRDFCSSFGKFFLQRALGIQRAEDTSAFRAIKREILSSFLHYDNYYVDIDALLAWVTDRFSSVRVRHQPRKYGKSNYTFYKLLSHTAKMVLSFTTLPLRLISIIGFIFTLFGLLLFTYVLAAYLIYSSAIPGFAFLASTITILSGAQLFALGLLGEYFAKMHFQIMGRPGAAVRSIESESGKSA